VEYGRPGTNGNLYDKEEKVEVTERYENIAQKDLNA